MDIFPFPWVITEKWNCWVLFFLSFYIHFYLFIHLFIVISPTHFFFPLYIMGTQLHIHVYVLFSPIIMLCHKYLDIVLNAVCSNMDGTRDSHTEWGKSERERQITYDITYIWYLTCSTNEPFHTKKIVDLYVKFLFNF